MNIKAPSSLLLLAVLATGNAYAKCASPVAPHNIPNGKKATLEQMVAAQKAVKDFDAATNEYTTCLQADSDAEIAKVAERETDPKKREAQQKKLQDAVLKKQNAAVDKDKALAARFNEQLRVFKAKDAQ